jgi:hypothetical protein
VVNKPAGMPPDTVTTLVSFSTMSLVLMLSKARDGLHRAGRLDGLGAIVQRDPLPPRPEGEKIHFFEVGDVETVREDFCTMNTWSVAMGSSRRRSTRTPSSTASPGAICRAFAVILVCGCRAEILQATTEIGRMGLDAAEVVGRQQRDLSLGIRLDEGAHALVTLHQLLVLQNLERAADGDARGLEFIAQLPLRRQLVAAFPRAGEDLVTEGGGDAVVGGGLHGWAGLPGAGRVSIATQVWEKYNWL